MTEFANGWDMDMFMTFHPEWDARKLLAGSLVDVEGID